MLKLGKIVLKNSLTYTPTEEEGCPVLMYRFCNDSESFVSLLNVAEEHQHRYGLTVEYPLIIAIAALETLGIKSLSDFSE